MKPLKSTLPLSIWLIRISLALFILQMFWFDLKNLHLSEPAFIMAVLFNATGLMILLGGILSKPWLTIISGIFLFGLSVYKLFLIEHEGLRLYGMAYLLCASLGVFFFSNGNA